MAKKTIAKIDPAQSLVTLINVYDVEPEKQQELVQLLETVTDKVMKIQPGFISVSVHSSIDGARVVNYAQWASMEDFQRMLKNEEAQQQIKRLAALAKSVSPSVYRVASVHA
jgi:quinol monooxygenase YgiN